MEAFAPPAENKLKGDALFVVENIGSLINKKAFWLTSVECALGPHCPGYAKLPQDFKQYFTFSLHYFEIISKQTSRRSYQYISFKQHIGWGWNIIRDFMISLDNVKELDIFSIGSQVGRLHKALLELLEQLGIDELKDESEDGFEDMEIDSQPSSLAEPTAQLDSPTSPQSSISTVQQSAPAPATQGLTPSQQALARVIVGGISIVGLNAIIDSSLQKTLKIEEDWLENFLANGGYVKPWFDHEAIQNHPGVVSWLERFFRLSKHMAVTYGDEGHRRSKALDTLIEAHGTVKKILNDVSLSDERRVEKPRGSRQP
ncbi:hypothetical protein N0V91_006741 [Didymella pomorum]|uniref:Uncharacterized protein n=1 Tax=Didymella pomorum TaxID=749634 RepID=A0A9W8ZCU6_9PLEO|nr:hypothetical protein N0V91_006741 [Didymella pomorum]